MIWVEIRMEISSNFIYFHNHKTFIIYCAAITRSMYTLRIGYTKREIIQALRTKKRLKPVLTLELCNLFIFDKNAYWGSLWKFKFIKPWLNMAVQLIDSIISVLFWDRVVLSCIPKHRTIIHVGIEIITAMRIRI